MKNNIIFCFIFWSFLANSQELKTGRDKIAVLKSKKSVKIDDSKVDSLFLQKKKNLLTATWDTPFGYSSVKSNHAPIGPYMGNGDVGVVCHTSENSQTFRISKVDFVTDGWSDWAGTGPAALPVGGVQIIVKSPVTRGFNYQMDQLGNELRMNTATAQPVKMKSWIAVNDNVMVTELTTTANTPINISVETFADSANAPYTTTSEVNNQVAQVTRQTKTAGARWISKAGISTRIIGAAATLIAVSKSQVNSSFVLTNAKTIYVLTNISGGGKTNNAKLPAAYTLLRSADVSGVARLRKAKAAWWKDMWSRSYVETNDELLDRHYLSSIYFLASAYNEHSPACGGMYGVWNMSDSMMYHGDIHLNYNSQAGFYSVFSANRPEIAKPFYNFIESIVPDGKRRAQTDMGSVHPSLAGKSFRGAVFLVGGLGIGVPYNYYWKQTMNAPFNVPLFSWYYEYTGDKDFLRNRAYPFIRECGDFYEDYMKKEAYGNTYRYSITTGAHEDSWDLNPPSDLGFVEQTFSLLLKYSKLLNVDAERRALWNDILSHLPKYKVVMPTKNPNKGLPVFAKNEAGWDYPNHMIQMHPVYPCEVLDLLSNPDTLQIARNTVDYYEVSQKGFSGSMNSLGLSGFIMAARVGFNPDVIIQNLRTLVSRAKPNFLINDGHHGAEKTALIETINSMMLQTLDSTLYLFPNWPKSAAKFTRLRTKGAFLVSANYDGKMVSGLKVFSEKGTRCYLDNPWKGNVIQITENGKLIASSKVGDRYCFMTKPGSTYILIPVKYGSSSHDSLKIL
ncbi:glycosyl hydrolase family 95 catalytic domain-containing protein [Pedobacter frigoris]|uniref:glycosyl hydrolase family 95 catalytic domain-containing protein n=1 Tax=Pedobacter frigoris TaxID=2571272 RepID=UPI00292D03FB|nr:hypothetical protein [Pedobacter frigoris]